LTFISDEGVDIYAFILEIHDFLHLPPLEPTNTKRMGVGFLGLVHDVIAVLPLDDLKAVFDKTETRKYFKTLVTAIHSLFVVSTDSVYLTYVCCCLYYLHTSLQIVVINALLLPTERGGHCQNVA
jgi:hypothetical protein